VEYQVDRWQRKDWRKGTRYVAVRSFHGLEKKLEDAEEDCDRAHRELEKQQTSYHSLPRKILKAPPTLPRLPRQMDLRLKLQPSPESKLADLELPAGMDDALAMAHAEDVEAWQKAISAVMPATGSVKFQRLLALTELEPVELLIGLLLGSWNLKQQGFYGEIEIWSEPD
jgi:hypothetical protein